MASPALLWLGIDGGATHSFGVVAEQDGRLLAQARTGSLNFFGSGLAEARRNLQQLVSDLEASLPPGAEFQRIVIGCAALFDFATEKEKTELCDGILPLDRTRLVGDALTAYHGATLGQPGVVVIGGTGSIVLARGETGDPVHVGGWGHLVGDEGSAYWLAREAVRAAIAAAEGRGPATALAAAVCQWFAVNTLPEIIPTLHSPRFTKEQFAGLARFLSDTMPAEDAAWRELLRQAGRELAAQAQAAIRLARVHLSPLPLFLVGGVLTHAALVRDSLVQALSATGPVRVEPAHLPPVLGALVLAFEDAGLVLTPARLARLNEARLLFP